MRLGLLLLAVAAIGLLSSVEAGGYSHHRPAYQVISILLILLAVLQEVL
jgi:hypothetical protein